MLCVGRVGGVPGRSDRRLAACPQEQAGGWANETRGTGLVLSGWRRGLAPNSALLKAVWCDPLAAAEETGRRLFVRVSCNKMRRLPSHVRCT